MKERPQPFGASAGLARHGGQAHRPVPFLPRSCAGRRRFYSRRTQRRKRCTRSPEAIWAAPKNVGPEDGLKSAAESAFADALAGNPADLVGIGEPPRNKSTHLGNYVAAVFVIIEHRAHIVCRNPP